MDITTRKKNPVGFAPAPEPLSPLFVRIPSGLAARLDRAAGELRRPKQELVAAALSDEKWALGQAVLPSSEPTPSEPEVLTTEQLAALLQVDEDTVRRLAAAGEIPGRKVGTHWRFARGAVLAWLSGSDG